jgi:hypothetical protein
MYSNFILFILALFKFNRFNIDISKHKIAYKVEILKFKQKINIYSYDLK